MIRKLVVLLALCCLPGAAAPVTERGEINGAAFRIDIPADWNGSLVMYCHGYSATPTRYEKPELNPQLQVIVDQGFAVAQSAYASTGWAIQDAMQDTEALRRYFIRTYGKPKETYVMGHSMGGFLTMMMLERFPNAYDGGFALCGPLMPAALFIMQRAFDLRVVFDYYFPELLPSPAAVPAGFRPDKALEGKLLAALQAAPERAADVRRFIGIRTNQELVGVLGFFTYVLKDLSEKAGGNPFDNRNTVYAGASDDNALNDGVKRYAADARAFEYARAYGTPTGRLERPLLALHTTYDVLVPPEAPSHYAWLSQQAGSGELFVQQYVKRDGHCTFQPQEIGSGFSQLRAWRSSGQRPPGGPLR